MNEHFRNAMNPKSKKYNCPFYKALRDAGITNVKFEIIDKAETQEELNQKEKYWIKYYNTNMKVSGSNGYNLSEGGEGH